ncbi:MAG: hypothetical protein ISR45_05125 [Rhodospirillales bacterium]|nr:hypothetical protein [Rhodospirillales bacterium]
MRVKSNDAFRFHRLWARLIEKGNLTEQENKRLESALDNMHENEEWLFDQWEEGTLRREFEPLLKIPGEII